MNLSNCLLTHFEETAVLKDPFKLKKNVESFKAVFAENYGTVFQMEFDERELRREIGIIIKNIHAIR